MRQQLPEGFGGERRRAVENKDPWQHFVYPAGNRFLFTPETLDIVPRAKAGLV